MQEKQTLEARDMSLSLCLLCLCLLTTYILEVFLEHDPGQDL